MRMYMSTYSGAPSNGTGQETFTGSHRASGHKTFLSTAPC